MRTQGIDQRMIRQLPQPRESSYNILPYLIHRIAERLDQCLNSVWIPDGSQGCSSPPAYLNRAIQERPGERCHCARTEQSKRISSPAPDKPILVTKQIHEWISSLQISNFPEGYSRFPPDILIRIFQGLYQMWDCGCTNLPKCLGRFPPNPAILISGQCIHQRFGCRSITNIP